MLIFLDIDGVLNRECEWNRMYSLNNDCIKYFADFAKTSDKIILTSTWKEGFVAPKSDKNTKQIKKLEAAFGEYGLGISGKTPTLKGRSRDKEIERYLYFSPDEEYIIIDDDKTLYKEIDSHNYFTNNKTGFSREDVKRCRKHLCSKIQKY